jgi:hypothetical protein
MKKLITFCVLLFFAANAYASTTINFDDVVGSQVDITNRYAGLGVTLNAIDNPFPLTGPYPAPATLPTIRGGVTTWLQGFPSAPSSPQVAVAAATPQTGDPGDGGILISFAFDVTSVSLVGNDVGFTGGLDDSSVTLTAYNAMGNKIGQVYSTINLPAGDYDLTPATISLPGMRYVAFNYTDTTYGFYSIDDLVFDTCVIPAPGAILLGSIGVGLVGWLRRRRAL